MDNLYAIILAGGAGTRLWPVSRQLAPKQLSQITGDLTLLQDTFRRLESRVPCDRMLFVTSDDFIFEIKRQISDLVGEKEADKCAYAGEKTGRNTAPAILAGALWVLSRDPEGLAIAAPSDHLILDVDAFSEAIDSSIEAANKQYLVTYGIKPTRPETGYGYIKAGDRIEGAYRVESFEEKPTPDRAVSLFEDGNYYWNSGIFFFSARTIVEEARKYLPDMMTSLERLDLENFSNIDDIYGESEPISIDYGVMERTDRAAVVPATMGWSDVGSWDSIYDLGEKDNSGNVKRGNIISVDTTDSLLIGSSRVTAVAGMKDVIVVDTEDALLICGKGESQDVRKIVDILQEKESGELINHTTVKKPWGSYTVLSEDSDHKVKRIVVNPGEKLSLQLHHHRSEHWIVVKGTAIVTRGEEAFTLKSNESTFIPQVTKHRIENPGESPLEIIEVWYGDNLSEEDIERFDDIYGRINEK